MESKDDLNLIESLMEGDVEVSLEKFLGAFEEELGEELY